MRHRMYGGVRGRGPQGPLLLDSNFTSVAYSKWVPACAGMTQLIGNDAVNRFKIKKFLKGSWKC